MISSRPSQRQQGSTLTLVVLLTMLVMALVLTATMSLSLSSRQTSSDQKITLQSQYGAESKLNLVRSRLRDIQRVLTKDGSYTPDVSNLAAPNGVVFVRTKNTPASSILLDDLALQFCGQSGSANAWKDYNANKYPDELKGTKICDVNTSGLTNQKFAILAYLVTDAGYSVLPRSDNAPSANASIADKTAWWDSYMNVSQPSYSYKVLPERVTKIGRTYRFYFKPTGISVKNSGDSNSSRLLGAAPLSTSDWWLQVTLPNPFDNALMLDHWTEDDGGFVNDVIKGNIFSNEKIRFLFSRNNASFLGDVNSVGCTQVYNGQCTNKTAGFFNSTTNLVEADSGVSNDEINSNLKNKMISTGTNIKGEADFKADYTALPLTAINQAQDARDSGIIIPKYYTSIQMYAGDNRFQPLSRYNRQTSSWQEPSNTYQFIVIKSPHYPDIVYYYGPDKKLYLYKNGRSYNQNKTFNGAIYSDSQIRVSGPSRLSGNAGDVSKMPPTLASFSKINLTSNKGMLLDTDLTMSDTPCGYDNKWYTGKTTTNQPGCPKDPPPTNQLALFAPNGDITVSNYSPDEVTYHAAIMTSRGTFNVEDYTNRRVQGTRHVVGAVVENHYGLNGTAAQDGTMTSGYADDFSQDTRLRDPDAIPSNPIETSSTWKFSNADSGSLTLVNNQVVKNKNYKSMSDMTWQQGAQ